MDIKIEEAERVNKKRSPKDIVVIVLMIISILYLLNPTAGVDFFPDFLPIIGNLDEGVATTILLSCLSYFGYNLTDLFTRKK